MPQESTAGWLTPPWLFALRRVQLRLNQAQGATSRGRKNASSIGATAALLVLILEASGLETIVTASVGYTSETALHISTGDGRSDAMHKQMDNDKYFRLDVC